MSTEAPSKPKLQVPEWAKEIKRKYLSQNISQFIIHGNINDYVRVVEGNKARYLRVRDFVSQEVFKNRDMVVYYDRSAGIRFKDDTRFGGESKMRREFMETLKLLAELSEGPAPELKLDPANAFYQLDKYFDNTLNQNLIQYLIRHIEEKLGMREPEANEKKANEDIIERFMKMTIPEFMDDGNKTPGESRLKQRLTKLKQLLKQPKSIALVIDYAETLIPMSESSRMRASDQMTLVFMQKWAKEDIFLNSDMTIAVITEKHC